MIGLVTDTVKIMPYDPEWATEFEKEKNILTFLLQGYEIDIQHVGSTSLIGCPAKPVIDIAIGISDLEYGKQLVPILVANGYIYKGDDGIPGRHYFKKRDENNNVTTHHIHMSPIGSEIWNNHILFRDFMREHPDVLQKYIDLKIMLAKQFPDDRESYRLGKKDFIDSIVNQEIERKLVRKRNY